MLQNFNAQALSAVAGVIGKTVTVDILRDFALQGYDALKAFALKDCAEVFAFNAGFKVGTGMATMQKAPANQAAATAAGYTGALKPKGIDSFYAYYMGFAKMAKIGDTEAILKATTSSLTGKKAKGEDKPEKPAKTEAPQPASIDDLIAALQSAHKAGALNPLHYAALAAIVPAPARSNVIDMGPAVEVTRELLAA